MVEGRMAPYCGIAGSILLFGVTFIVLTWIGVGLLSLHLGGTMVATVIMAGIAVHAYCTYRIDSKRKHLGG